LTNVASQRHDVTDAEKRLLQRKGVANVDKCGVVMKTVLKGGKKQDGFDAKKSTKFFPK
jgi:hypothetical protein